jgi:hypothetical protein
MTKATEQNAVLDRYEMVRSLRDTIDYEAPDKTWQLEYLAYGDAMRTRRLKINRNFQRLAVDRTETIEEIEGSDTLRGARLKINRNFAKLSGGKTVYRVEGFDIVDVAWSKINRNFRRLAGDRSLSDRITTARLN